MSFTALWAMLRQGSLLVRGAEAQDKVQNPAPELGQRHGSCTGLHGNQCLSKVRWYCHRLWDSPVQYICTRQAILLKIHTMLGASIMQAGRGKQAPLFRASHMRSVLSAIIKASFRSLERSSVNRGEEKERLSLSNCSQLVAAQAREVKRVLASSQLAERREDMSASYCAAAGKKVVRHRTTHWGRAPTVITPVIKGKRKTR